MEKKQEAYFDGYLLLPSQVCNHMLLYLKGNVIFAAHC